MAASRESNKKKNTVRSKKTRSSSKKKKPKVLLNSKYVCILCAGIVFFCAILLTIAFLLSRSPDDPYGKESAPVALTLPEKKTAKPSENRAGGQKDSGLGITGGSSGTSESRGASGGASRGATGSSSSNATDSGASSSGGRSGSPLGAGLSGADLSGADLSGAGKASNAGGGKEIASVKKPVPPDSGIMEARPKFNIQPAKNGAKLAFVIDDGGMNAENVKKYALLPFPITVAVLPGLSHSAECAAIVKKAGKELILHQPMQAKNLSINPGPGAITPDMDSYTIAGILEKNLSELGGGVKGFNNHEGSLITEDKVKMTFIIDLAMQKGLYFLDSRTSSQSQARQAALELDTHIIERNAPFLDNAVTRADMLTEIYKALDVANRQGFAVIIGHVDKSAAILPELLQDMYPELLAKGYIFTTPSKL